MNALTITAICGLFEVEGSRTHAQQPLSLMQHALQTAWLAERARAERSLICACLLHDLGHLLDEQADRSAPAHEDQHPAQAALRLGDLFGAAVTEPIRLHVEAKRYLCYARPGYEAGLPLDAKRSLQRQGGALAPEQARAFMREPYAIDAVNLRLWDDRARTAGLTTPSLAYFAALLRTCVLPKSSLAGAGH